MLVLPGKLHGQVILALQKLARRDDVPQDVQMDLQFAAGALVYSRHLTEIGSAAIEQHAKGAIVLLDQFAEALQDPAAPVEFLASIRLLQEKAQALSGQPLDGPVDRLGVLDRTVDFLLEFDQFLMGLVQKAPPQSQSWLADTARPLLNWQERLSSLSQVAATEEAVSQNTAVDPRHLQALLRERMDDTGLSLTDWTALTGGFGKDTSLFKLTGGNTSADLVMRRDVDASLISGIDCHQVKQEYPLLKAIFELGFPVPEPLLLETDSALVKGPDFMIVRRVPGRVEGDQFGAEEQVPEPIQRELAQITAKLHGLPPLPAVVTGSKELRPELWGMTIPDSVRDYINAWYTYYLARPHTPIPALHSAFHWLLHNVPEVDGQPTLVHGDMGLHNLMFEQGQMSAVLDWEFAHIGDPAEDLGIIYTSMVQQLNWEEFLDQYGRSGRSVPSMQRVLFFEIWMYCRNLSIASMCLEQFASGHLKQIRYAVFITRFMPYYVERIATLIREWNY